jgi:acyl-CoA thioesterase I
MSASMKKGMKILFLGDSITDCGRREPAYKPMGRGYVSLIYRWLIARYPSLGLQFFNRGISSDRSRDLVRRWDEDCQQIQPDLLSILVGINDTWRRYESKDPTSVEDFEKNYEAVLQRVAGAGNPILVLCEPFLLAHPQGIEVLREDLDPKIQVVREMARKYGAIYVPYDGIFAAASISVAPSYWAEDGMSPTDAGHALMAQVWMEYVLGEVP